MESVVTMTFGDYDICIVFAQNCLIYINVLSMNRIKPVGLCTNMGCILNN